MKQHLMRNINIISRCASLYRDEHLKHTGISGWQAPYIPKILSDPGITQDQLAAVLHVNKSNVKRQLSMLEENGFVERKRSETDKRAVEVYPTKKAEEVEPEIRRVYGEWRNQLFSGMDEDERDMLEEILEKLAKRAEDIR